MTEKRILFVSKGVSASSRYRAIQYFPYLQSEGYFPIHITASGGVAAVLRTLWQVKHADVVVILRKTFPAPLTWVFRVLSKKLFFDFDDALFCSSNGAPSKTRRNRLKVMVRQVDHVLAGNQYLANESLKMNAAVSVIPTSLDTKRYNVTADKPVGFIDLVWIGSSSTSKYLIDLLPVLNQAAEKNFRLRLKIIADFNIEDAKIPIIAIQWSEEAEIRELANAHIGIAPMVDNDWTRGKCALKVLQYMAAKLPVISSHIGVNAEAVLQGETGYLVTSEDKWLIAIENLAEDQVLREKLGLKGLQRVKEMYDIDVVAQQFLAVLK
ncbi:MAG: glycosyltransferase involved in cell wall biosynthesis [Methylophagaceae bacterium]|jgi:glycosyltransferase involved in cell wall biosynthesis